MMVCLKCVGWMERGGQNNKKEDCVCLCEGVIGCVCVWDRLESGSWCDL